VSLTKIPPKQTTISSTNTESSYQVIYKIYEDDQSLIDNEIDNLDKILVSNKHQIKGLSDAKSFLYKETNKCNENSNISTIRIITPMNQRLRGRRYLIQDKKIIPDRFSRRSQYPTSGLYQNANIRTTYNSPLLSKRTSINRETASELSSPGNIIECRYPKIVTKKGNSMNNWEINRSTHRASMSNSSLIIPAQRKLHRSIQRKLIKFEQVLNADDYTDNKISDAKRQLILNEYKEDRFKRTARILSEIESDKSFVIKELYKYKLNSILNSQKDTYIMKKKFRNMLKDPKRVVAKIEKQRRVKKMSLKLFNKKKI